MSFRPDAADGRCLVTFQGIKDNHVVVADWSVGSTADHGKLVLLVVARNHPVGVVEKAAVVHHLFLAVTGQGGAEPGRDIAEPAFLELLLEFQVHHFFAVGGHACELFGIAHLVDDLDLVHHLGRQVLEGHLRVVEEEGLAADRNLLDRLAVVFHRSVAGNVHSGHPLEQVFQHLVLSDDEGRGIEDDCVLPDLDGIADGRHTRGLQHLGVLRQVDRAQIHRPFIPGKRDVVFLPAGLVSQHLDGQVVGASRHFGEVGHAGRVGQREIGDQRVALGRQVGGCIGNGCVRPFFQDFHFYVALFGAVASIDDDLGWGGRTQEQQQ